MEFALVAPLLFLLLFGIIEFGWAFLQYLDVRHGGREGMRLAAVNADPGGSGTQAESIANEVCTRMDPGGVTLINITLNGSDIGDEVTVTVTEELETLTGFLDTFLGDVELETSVSTRLEQEATYTNLVDYPCP